MAPKAHQRPGAKSTFRDAWIRTFGFSLKAPQAGARLKFTIAIVALLGTGVAAAAWQVNDRNTQQKIEDVKDRLGNDGTVTGRMKDLNRKLQVTPRGGTTPEMIAEPLGAEKLDANQPSTTAVAIEYLCTAGAMTSLGQRQHNLCRDLANTELAQYRFSLRMFDRAKVNYDRLKQIEDRRRALGAEDYANLQLNTNELLALTALMDNDRDRYQTYMAAYSARLDHIRNAQAALTRNALKGTGSLSLTSL